MDRRSALPAYVVASAIPINVAPFKILRDYRRAAHTLTDTASGIAHIHNIILLG
ncbi:hypothetical protein Vqi01_57490 [Micromonospora qiuiae]|uniref:Uncharacterized protein n=1 Tax=Micromonospora qiuiae TaxID=502268 RepID=A0ABQ4JJ12_9ACTN|nr:hypothetical protein Vqi01_57490 [Micromonospora qiuiae]